MRLSSRSICASYKSSVLCSQNQHQSQTLYEEEISNTSHSAISLSLSLYEIHMQIFRLHEQKQQKTI